MERRVQHASIIVSSLATVVIVVVLTLVWVVAIALIKGSTPRAPYFQQRVAFALAVATTAAVLAWTVWSRPQPQVSDLAQVWAGARALLHGENPYQAVGPGRTFNWPYPLLYPLTAVLALMPFAWLPLRWVDPLFVAFGFGLFTFAVTRRTLRTPALVALVSIAALMTLQTSQWSLLLTGAALLPACGLILVAKPTIGLALFAAFPARRVVIGCAVVLVASVLVQPQWLIDWRATFASAPHVVAPITRLGGPLLLLALLKWKRADARLLLGMACVPHTTVPYETIPLFLIPRTWLEAWVLWALGLVAYIAQWASGPYPSQEAYWAGGARWIVLVMYLPCLAMVLRRPNEWSGPAIDDERCEPV
ncbi:MAG TPA: hypothetical protein VKD69_11730 [Vicinamibacterales bacterium]|nr:hypothetical protein [Vicinamibacterales bacterium]